VEWLKRIFKKFFTKKMSKFNEAVERAAQYQSMYAGEKFQCMKTPDPKDSRLGDVFSVIRIEPGNDGNVYVVLNDKSKLVVDRFNNMFSMITNDSPVLPKEVVKRSQLSSIPKATEFAATMESLDQTQIQKIQQSAINNTEKPIEVPSLNQVVFGTNQTEAPKELPVSVSVNQPTSPDLAKSLFGLFALQPTKVEFEAAVNLPDLSLIQMMYAQSVDKEEFLTKFSTYVMQGITLDVIKQSMISILEPKPKKIRVPKS